MSAVDASATRSGPRRPTRSATPISRQGTPDDGFELGVRLNAAGNPVKTVAHTISGLASILRSLPRRVDLGEVDLPDIAALAELRDAVEHALRDCVRRLRAELDDRTGRSVYSWSMIGRALGMTKQSAQERFGS